MNTVILKLREQIKTSAQEQVDLRKSRMVIKATEKSDARSQQLSNMHWRKLGNRSDLRELYLAYAYARGRSYASIEGVTNPNKGAYLDEYVSNVLTSYGFPVTRAQVKAWIAGENPQILVVAETQSAAE